MRTSAERIGSTPAERICPEQLSNQKRQIIQIGVCVCVPPCVAKLVLCVPFLLGWQGSLGQQIQEVARRAMKPMLVQGHTLRLLDDAREPGISSTRNQKTRTVSTC